MRIKRTQPTHAQTELIVQISSLMQENFEHKRPPTWFNARINLNAHIDMKVTSILIEFGYIMDNLNSSISLDFERVIEYLLRYVASSLCEIPTINEEGVLSSQQG